MEESPSLGRRQAMWACVIGMCPVDDRAGKRSECFALKGASRSQPSEGRRRPWVGVRGKGKDNYTNDTVNPSPSPLRQPEACHALVWKQRLSFFYLIYKIVFLIKKKKSQKSMQNQRSGGDVKHRTKHRKWDDIKRTAVPKLSPRNTCQPVNAIMTIPAPPTAPSPSPSRPILPLPLCQHRRLGAVRAHRIPLMASSPLQPPRIHFHRLSPNETTIKSATTCPSSRMLLHEAQ